MKRQSLTTVLLLLMCMLLTITSCGKKDSEDKKTKNTQEAVAEEGGNSLPSEKQMAKDIDTFGANNITLYNNSYTLETSSVKIDKAKEEEEQYIVYCTATQESDMFTAHNSYCMTYNFYDVGGWILDVCYAEEVNMTPKTCVPESETRAYASGGYNFTSLTCSNTEKVSDTEYVVHYVGKYEYNYMDDVYNIDVLCAYDNQYGWRIVSNLVSTYHDWSKMYGTWYGEGVNGKYKYTVKIVVKEVNDNTGKIKFDVDITDEEGFCYYRNVKEAHHKDVIMDIDYNINIYAMYPPEGAEYLLDDNFNYYVEDVPSIDGGTMKWDEDISLMWGKDIGMKHCSIGDRKSPILTKISK